MDYPEGSAKAANECFKLLLKKIGPKVFTKTFYELNQIGIFLENAVRKEE